MAAPHPDGAQIIVNTIYARDPERASDARGCAPVDQSVARTRAISWSAMIVPVPTLAECPGDLQPTLQARAEEAQARTVAYGAGSALNTL
jgi:hypothetical protein